MIYCIFKKINLTNIENFPDKLILKNIFFVCTILTKKKSPTECHKIKFLIHKQ